MELSYHSKRMQLVASALERMMFTAPFSVSLHALSKELQLGVWETQHLFQEYVGCDPIKVLHQSWSPALAFIQKPIQLSIFDGSEPVVNGRFLTTVCDLERLSEEPVQISYEKYVSCLGEVFIASVNEGICQLTFEDAENGLERLQKSFPKALLIHESTDMQKLALNSLKSDGANIVLPLRVKASAFQLAVWNRLLHIPSGALQTYSTIADELGDQKASRAVGTAVGANPIGLFIPCHRVVNQSGKIGHYRWGVHRKRLLLAIER